MRGLNLFLVCVFFVSAYPLFGDTRDDLTSELELALDESPPNAENPFLYYTPTAAFSFIILID